MTTFLHFHILFLGVFFQKHDKVSDSTPLKVVVDVNFVPKSDPPSDPVSDAKIDVFFCKLKRE